MPHPPPSPPPSPAPGASGGSLQVGLTGGIASGKSTVGRFMAELGCTVTDADRLVAELYQPGRAGARAVADAFGTEVLDGAGAVDKERLASIVFSDAEARRRLESIVHPLVRLRFAELAGSARGLVVFEATLLVEGGGFRAFDALVTVEADPELRLRRAVERGLSRREAEARMAAQATEAERVAVADHVIRNEGSLEELRAATEAVVRALEGRLTAS